MTDRESPVYLDTLSRIRLDPVTAITPRCAVHGEMRYHRGNWWVCPGWDGEGCCAFAAEMLSSERAIVQPAPGSQPSRWGYRAAVPVTVLEEGDPGS